ncbi:MAG: phospholipid scramblase-related protein [Myxococcota bacterium]
MGDELELDWGSRAPRHPGNEQRPASPPPKELAPAKGLPPGHPSGMPEGLRFRTERFFTDSHLRVSQSVEMLQALVGWDQANTFDVRGEDGGLLFCAQEQSRGVLGALSRNLNPFYKNTTDCMTSDGSLFLRCTFPFTFFFRRCEVQAWDGKPLGVVQNRFHLLKFRADLCGTNGAVLLEVHGPMLKFLSFTDWVFEVRRGEQVVARIKKHWSGFFREAFTESDRLSITFEPGFTDPRLRLLVFAAALTVDATAFEKKDRHFEGGDLLQNLFKLLR